MWIGCLPQWYRNTLELIKAATVQEAVHLGQVASSSKGPETFYGSKQSFLLRTVPNWMKWSASILTATMIYFLNAKERSFSASFLIFFGKENLGPCFIKKKEIIPSHNSLRPQVLKRHTIIFVQLYRLWFVWIKLKTGGWMWAVCESCIFHFCAPPLFLITNVDNKVIYNMLQIQYI